MQPASADDWLALAQKSLRGRDLSDLVATIRDGIEIRPLYSDGPERPAAVTRVDTRRSEAGWDVRQHHSAAADRAGTPAKIRGRMAGPSVAGTAAAAGADAVGRIRGDINDDLAGGVTSVELDAAAGVDADGLGALFAQVDLAATPVALAPHAELASAAALVELGARRGAALAPGSSLGLDPLGEWARAGSNPGCAEAAEWAARAEVGGAVTPGVMAFAVDATRYADAGATEGQALGWATATGVEYLRALVEAGISVDEAAGLIGFRLAATADQFVTIAALRAARVMWARVVTACGGSAEAARQHQHAVTAIHMYSRRDPWVNLLRGAAAALAAGVAGADAVTVLPFDHLSGTVNGDADGALGRRLARNTQLLLLEESHLARAADPAGGSFYVESLTEELASQGWRVLQEVEASGGIGAAVADGALAAAIEQSWQDRLGAVRTRREPLTGVSEFPLLDDPDSQRAVDPDSIPAATAPQPESDDAESWRATDSGARPGAMGLPIRRLAEPFEDLRDAADRHHAATGARPAAWVAALGSAEGHSNRRVWAQNLLAVAGVEARGAAGVDSPVAAAADFAASGLAVAVIAGDDDMYRERGPATAAALADSGAGLVALVCDPGTPADLLDALRSAGAVEIWHDGIDVVSTLQSLHRTLGIAWRPSE